MILAQDGAGAVTGSIVYSGAQSGAITGHVVGDDFYCTRSDTDGYWATCWPCTIAPDGKSFHGFGTHSLYSNAVEWYAEGSGTRSLVVVLIDINPGSYPNSVNPGANGVIPVAILTTPSFDASTVDPATFSLAGNSAWGKGKSGNYSSLKDVDGDGDLDLVIQVANGESWGIATTSAVLTGQPWGRAPIQGADSGSFVL